MCLHTRPAEACNGHRVARAPKGAAVFETVREEALTGVVVERLQSNGFTTVSSGVLEHEDAQGHRLRLSFGSDDLVVCPPPLPPRHRRLLRQV